MRLTTEQWNELRAELTKRGIPTPCRECGKNLFDLPNCVFEVREFEPEEDVCGVFPIVMLTCNNCGNVRFFNAKILNDKRLEHIALGDGVFLDFREKSGR